jgi:nucleotide-binding universal stress UspA family protein
MHTTVIWATDGSDGADAALEEARRLLGGSPRLVVVHCDQRLGGRAAGYPALADEDELRLKIRRQVEALQAGGVACELIVRRSHRAPADIVASIAGEVGGDLIVCGTRGLGGLSGAVLGSFTQRLLHVAPCSVLAVRGGGAAWRTPARSEQGAEVGA